MMVIGGAEIYKTALPKADKLYITKVDADIEGDAFFPEVDESIWEEVSRESFSAKDSALKTNAYNYAFCCYERRDS